MSDTGKRREGIRDLPGGMKAGRQIQSQDVADKALNFRKFNMRHLYIEPKQQPIGQIKGGTGAVPSGSTGAVNILSFPHNGTLEMVQLGAGQTLVMPTLAADGLEISGDQADDEGREFCAGLLARAAGVFVVGTDPAFFFRCRMTIDDVSGTDQLVIGWRKNQAYQSAYTSYTDYAALKLNAGQWYSVTNLNNGGETATSLGASFVVADLGAFEVQINVSAAGLVTYEVGTDGSRSTPSLAPAFTLDTGDTVTPFIWFLHSADLADSVRLRQFEAGFIAGTT